MLVYQLCLTLCDMDCNQQSSSIHGVLTSKNSGGGVTIPFSRGIPNQGSNSGLLLHSFQNRVHGTAFRCLFCLNLTYIQKNL